MELRQWQVMKLLAEQASVKIVHEAPADLSLSYQSAAETIAEFGVATYGAPFPPLGLGIVAADLPWLVAHSVSESQRQKEAQVALIDPIPVVQKRLLAALRMEPTLGSVEWVPVDCAGSAPCPNQHVSIALRTTKREIRDPFWSMYSAELLFVRDSEAAWRAECVSVDTKPVLASSPFEDIQKNLDELAAVCAEQLVTALLGRGRALPFVSPP